MTSQSSRPAKPRSRRPSAAIAVSVFGTSLSVATAVLVLGSPEPLARPVLLYDEADIEAQTRPYVEAGYFANEVITRAFDTAIARGHLILRRSDSVAGGPQYTFRLSDFVALPKDQPVLKPAGLPHATPLSPREAPRLLSEPIPQAMRDLFRSLSGQATDQQTPDQPTDQPPAGDGSPAPADN